MLGVYFSGTGNTRYCLEKFMEYYNGSKPVSIENPDVIEAIKKSVDIVFGYPIYYSNTPKIVKDFISQNRDIFRNKRIYVVCTMGLFSGDGAGCGARLLKKCGATIVGGLHLKMPDCISDSKLLKKTSEQNKQLVKNAENKIAKAVNVLKQGDATKDGLSVIHHIAGLFGQRLWFYKKTLNYTDKLKVADSLCVGCEKCVTNCPMNNLSMQKQKATSKGKCTMCYRCINTCPQKAITLMGDKIIEQSFIEKYIM
jgi:ferredoxin